MIRRQIEVVCETMAEYNSRRVGMVVPEYVPVMHDMLNPCTGDIEPYDPRYSLPIGWMDLGESPVAVAPPIRYITPPEEVAPPPPPPEDTTRLALIGVGVAVVGIIGVALILRM